MTGRKIVVYQAKVLVSIMVIFFMLPMPVMMNGGKHEG